MGFLVQIVLLTIAVVTAAAAVQSPYHHNSVDISPITANDHPEICIKLYNTFATCHKVKCHDRLCQDTCYSNLCYDEATRNGTCSWGFCGQSIPPERICTDKHDRWTDCVSRCDHSDPWDRNECKKNRCDTPYCANVPSLPVKECDAIRQHAVCQPKKVLVLDSRHSNCTAAIPEGHCSVKRNAYWFCYKVKFDKKKCCRTLWNDCFVDECRSDWNVTDCQQ